MVKSLTPAKVSDTNARPKPSPRLMEHAPQEESFHSDKVLCLKELYIYKKHLFFSSAQRTLTKLDDRSVHKKSQ